MSDEDIDPEENHSRQKARIASIVAIVVGLPFGYFGAGRTYEVVRQMSNGVTVPEAFLGLAIRPISVLSSILVISVQLAFLVWQISVYRSRSVLLLIPGALAGVLIVSHVLFNSYMESLMECQYMPIARSGWFFLGITLAILFTASWIIGRIGRFLVGPQPCPWLTARMAAFAWTNGGLMLMASQLLYVYFHFGTGIFK